MKQTGSQRSRPGGGRRSSPPENLVAEIVDQITSKQARAIASAQPRGATADTCDFCLDRPVAGSPYHLVLKCTTGEDPPSDH